MYTTGVPCSTSATLKISPLSSIHCSNFFKLTFHLFYFGTLFHALWILLYNLTLKVGKQNHSCLKSLKLPQIETPFILLHFFTIFSLFTFTFLILTLNGEFS